MMAKKFNPFMAKFEKGAADRKADRAKGIKEGGAADKALDAKMAKKVPMMFGKRKA